MFWLVYAVLSPFLLQLENFYLSGLRYYLELNTSLMAPTANNQHPSVADIQLFDSSEQRNRENVINDPLAIAFFSELGLNEEFLNSGKVLAWALPRDDPNFVRIYKYVEHSQGWTFGIKVLNILRVLPRPKSLVDFKDDPNATGKLRMMLWHGTKTINLQSILENGLEVPKGDYTYGSFGQGIYFSDRVWKSALYLDNYGQVVGKQGYLFLSEVLLGNIFKTEMNLPNLTEPPQPQHYQSVQGLGKWYPDPDCTTD